MSLLSIEEPARAPAAGWALWQLGFRPFYLLAGAFSALSIGLWGLQLGGWLGRPYLHGALWHAHEMLFGYVLAVMVGFLFTAGRNWSGRPTPSGAALGALALLWLAGRVLVLTPWAWAAALVNVAFPLAAAAALARALFGAHNRRNYFFVGLLVLLGLAQASLHLAQLGAVEPPAWLGVHIGLDLVLFIMAVMAGRVLPMFTNNGVRGANARQQPAVEWLALGSIVALLLADASGLQGAALAPLLGGAALLHLLRLTLWRPWRTLRVPLVWVLHAAYLWIVLHLGLRAAAELHWVAPTLAWHALTTGAIGLLTIGMMTRTARGHTARALRADGFDVGCYLLVLGAAVLRVLLPLFLPTATAFAWQASAALWSGGFALFTWRYWPVLTRARLDGKPG
jgi:uncharacterized protein involved in response to NO